MSIAAVQLEFLHHELWNIMLWKLWSYLFRISLKVYVWVLLRIALFIMSEMHWIVYATMNLQTQSEPLQGQDSSPLPLSLSI